MAETFEVEPIIRVAEWLRDNLRLEPKDETVLARFAQGEYINAQAARRVLATVVDRMQTTDAPAEIVATAQRMSAGHDSMTPTRYLRELASAVVATDQAFAVRNGISVDVARAITQNAFAGLEEQDVDRSSVASGSDTL